MRILILVALVLLPAVVSAKEDNGPSEAALKWARKVLTQQLEAAPAAPELSTSVT